MGTIKMVDASTLAKGDTFTKFGVTVTVLGDQEPCYDRFRQRQFRYWCRREDTGVEGWCTFGPGGVVTP